MLARNRVARRLSFALLAAASIHLVHGDLLAQTGGFGRVSAVGGVSVDASGLLSNPTQTNDRALQDAKRDAQLQADADLVKPSQLRKVSLRQLDMLLAGSRHSGQPVPDEVFHLAGLQEIRYVFVYPELNDIVLAGFGEGWKIDDRGFAVGLTTGRPVLLLDDLLVALRTADEAARGGISCSIDPTPEGLQRLMGHLATLRGMGNRNNTLRNIEQQLGPQIITIRGVPETSHFARVLVAADYRMKRLAMNFEPAPVKGLPSFLQMMKSGRGMPQSMLPRWWLATNYDSLSRDPEGLAWELRGAGVKAMTEDDYLSTGGQVQHTGKANPVAQQWADNMTGKYAELSVKDPIFGQLRGCMDLAVISALILKEGLMGRVGYDFATLLDETGLPVEEFAAPKRTNSIASVVDRGRDYLISASGGVQVNSWGVIGETPEESEEPAQVRVAAESGRGDRWWWN